MLTVPKERTPTIGSVVLWALVHAHVRPVLVIAPDGLVTASNERAYRVGDVPAGRLECLPKHAVGLVILDLRAGDAAFVGAAIPCLSDIPRRGHGCDRYLRTNKARGVRVCEVFDSVT